MVVSVTKYPISGGNNVAATWNTVLNEIGGDFVSSGLTPTDGSGLNLTIQNGIAYCAGVRHAITGGNR